jgi:hypothetical protein
MRKLLAFSSGKTGFHSPDHALTSPPMPLHLIKLAVGCESVKELKARVAERMQSSKKKGLPLRHIHITRMTPKRVDELLAGGSLYWVVQGRYRPMPACDAAEGDRGVATPDAALPGLALFH